MSVPPAHLRELLEALVAADIRFVLVGGLAVAAWGHVRGTRDIDIVPDPDPENLERLARALVDMEGRVIAEGRPLEADSIRTFLGVGDKTLVRTELGEVDVLQGLPQVPRFDELASRAKRVDLDRVSILVCSLEDLLAMKRAADRPVDRVDIEALEIAHGEAKEGS